MSDELIQWKVDTSAVEGYLPAKGDAVVAALMERTNAVNLKLQAKILGKLEGDPIKSHTHKLSGSVRVIPTTNDGAKINGGVQAGGGPAFYAKFLEDGTQPHVIMPKDPKGVLAFMIAGQMVFRKKVMHPGNKPYLFMKGTLAENKENIVASLQSAVVEAVK